MDKARATLEEQLKSFPRDADSVQRSAADAETSSSVANDMVANIDHLTASAEDLRGLVAHFRV